MSSNTLKNTQEYKEYQKLKKESEEKCKELKNTFKTFENFQEHKINNHTLGWWKKTMTREDYKYLIEFVENCNHNRPNTKMLVLLDCHKNRQENLHCNLAYQIADYWGKGGYHSHAKNLLLLPDDAKFLWFNFFEEECEKDIILIIIDLFWKIKTKKHEKNKKN